MPEYESGLEAVARSDRLLDALAAGARMSPADPVASMLAGWRDDVRRTPDTDVISLAEAATALAEGKQARPTHRFGITVVGAVAAALLCIGGFGAVIYGARPGDPLYGLHTALFGSMPTTRADQVALAAQTELEQVQQLVQQGQWQQAQDKLAAVSTTVQDVSDVQQKQDLINQWNNLTAKVVARDPGATLAPGAPAPLLPGMTTPLLPGPNVVPGLTSPSSSTSSTSSSTSPTSPSSPTSPTSSTSSTSPTTTTTGSEPTTSSTSTATTSSVGAPPPAASTTTSTTTAAPPPPASSSTITTTTTVSSAPRSEDTGTSSSATSSQQQQQQAPAVVQQQTSETPATSTAANEHGGEHGSAPGPRGNGQGNGPGNGPEAPATTAERGGN
jgi:Anti-sigma-D factor RsdA to sigma factor binding region